MVAGCLLAASYLSSQPPFPDLGDVGVCRVQLVKIHLVELVIELLPQLPGQVVVAESRNGWSKVAEHNPQCLHQKVSQKDRQSFRGIDALGLQMVSLSWPRSKVTVCEEELALMGGILALMEV